MRYTFFFVVLFCLACSKSESPPSARTEAQPDLPAETDQAPAEAKTDSEASALPALAPPSTRVINAGEPPRRVLRWNFKKGSKETLEIRQELKTATATRPPVVYTLKVEAKEVDEDGTARVAFSVANVEVIEAPANYPPPQLATLEAAVGRVKGTTGTYSVDSRGVVTTTHVVPIDPGDAAVGRLLRILLYHTMVPIPEEEIGQGGKWTVRRVIDEGGIRTEEVSTVELTKLEEFRVDMMLKIERTAPQQQITGPGAGPGGTLTVLGIESEGSGIGQWDLTRLVPLSSKTESPKKTLLLDPAGDANTPPVEVREDTVWVMTRK